MCVRIKTTYGCGHVYKASSDCDSIDCSGVDKCHYEKEGDCRGCRLDGVTATKREGGARRTQQMRSRLRDGTPSSSQETLSADDLDTSVDISPWSSQRQGEKTSWDSPHRRRADEAWVSEHENRISDLHDRMEKVKISGGRSRPKHTKLIALAPEDCDYDGSEQDDYDFIQPTPSKKPLHIEMRRRLDDRAERSHATSRQDRQHSHDSLPDSMPSYRSSPKIKKSSTFNVVSTYPEVTHEYDYYNNPSSGLHLKHHRRHHQGPSRSRSDSYHIRSRSHGHESDYEIAPVIPPLQMPPPAMYDTYDYYSPNASPSGVPYPLSDYPCEQPNHHAPPSLRPPHYVGYRRF